MKTKGLKVPALILAIGIVLAVVVCLFTSVVMTPAVTEHTFPYSVTYQLNGETKTLEGVYQCTYEGFTQGQNPRDRYYTGETISAQPNTIAEIDGARLYIVTQFNDCYLMNDTKNRSYESSLAEPYLESVDKEGCEILPEDRPREFAAEIVSWEYPQPVENAFTFGGFALMHTDSMVAMLVVGLLTILACIIFVKKDKSLRYNGLDIISIVVNCAVCFLAIPFITVTAAFFQLTMNTDGLSYQIYMCIPAFTALTVAASIALRRKGLRKTGFFIQFLGPILYIVPMLFELI